MKVEKEQLNDNKNRKRTSCSWDGLEVRISREDPIFFLSVPYRSLANS